MANDRNDFLPEVRNSAWWSGDSRMAASGKAGEAVLQKIGIMERPDLSEVEAVQMGHVMQPVIGQLAQKALGIELKDADYSLTHPKETWLKSHFDFISADGQTLVEAKNYNALVRNKFDAQANIIPEADMAQLVHEAAVHDIRKIVLAVLFGGQNFETFSFYITDEQKNKLVTDMAVFWGHVQAKKPLEPTSTTESKLIYAESSPSIITASKSVEEALNSLRFIKDQIKSLEEREEQLQAAVQAYMQSNSELVSFDGKVLATWKSAKASKRFDSKLFQASMPDVYEKFVVETPGSRRFLVK